MHNSRKTPHFPDPKPTIELVVAEQQLLAHLGEAMKLISEGGVKTREGMMEAIEAVICFLQDRGVSGQQIWPFGYLFAKSSILFSRASVRPYSSRVLKSRDDILGKRYAGAGKQQIRVFAAAMLERNRTCDLQTQEVRVTQDFQRTDGDGLSLSTTVIVQCFVLRSGPWYSVD